MPHGSHTTETWDYPWNHPALREWSIVGMNHYNDPEGRRCLFVAMTNSDNRCIKSEGHNEGSVWLRLMNQANRIVK